jgi:uncharacterized phage protein (TIGR02218 family)
MKNPSAGFITHIAGELTTLATCWKITRTDGQVYGFTNHDQSLSISGVTYLAETGFSATAIRTAADFAVDNLDVMGVLDAATITAADLRAGLWDFAAVEIFDVNWATLADGVLNQRKGWIGEVRSGRSGFVAELRGLTQRLQQTIGRLYGAACDAELGDARCGVTLASYTVTGTVTGVTSRRVFADSALTDADGYFDQGKITWTGGENDGLSMEVKTYLLAGGAIALVLPMPFDVAIGDTYSLSAGCDKLFPTCGTKFSNKINFRGFPHVPGLDRLVSGGL